MPSLTLLAAVLVSAVALVQVSQDLDEGPFRVAVDVDFVVFNVTVTDRGGQLVSGLDASAFEVFEDGRPQTVSIFQSDDATSSIGLVIDSSGSMGGRHQEVARAAVGFVEASGSENEFFVLNFNEAAWLGLPAWMPFTRDPSRIRAALVRDAPSGMTALYDALLMGLDHLKRGTRDRRALVVLSDGGDNASRASMDELRDRLRASTASVYTIGVYDELSSDRNPQVLREIAERGAGRSYFPETSAELLQVWGDIAAEMRSQYTIGYRPDNPVHDGRFRSVRITATGDRGRSLGVTARDGYFAPPAR